ncbi:chloride channel protein [Faecalicoccus acidiformans]|uniref:Chloride channel protein n=1 Tax=Faecalicoccus acidiformans TaxID=915173 RepID=A0ABS2FLI9_9FIRM|nr:chloride channel protein [Faecalicoccus acidiformans]MBM6830629.1 chloride channel protein [Faecalicoccus acidiformans]
MESLIEFGRKKGRFIVFCLFLGLVIGMVESIFVSGVRLLTDLHLKMGSLFLWGLPVGALLTRWLIKNIGHDKQNIEQIFQAEESAVHIPLRNAPLAISEAWISHLLGACTGRAGASLQLGSAIGSFLQKRIPVFSMGCSLTCGIAAALSCLFGCPIAAAFFAVEIFSRRWKELPYALLASLMSYSVHLIFQIPSLRLSVLELPSFSWGVLFKIFLCAVLFGLVGNLFARSLQWARSQIQKSEHAIVLIIVLSLILMLLLMFIRNFRYIGTGEILLQAVFEGEQVFLSDWIWKAVLTILTSACGFVGGEMTPMFSVGASLGVVCGPLVGLDPLVCAAIGMLCVFGAGTHSIWGTAFFGIEIFGLWFVPLSLTAGLASCLTKGKWSVYRLNSK